MADDERPTAGDGFDDWLDEEPGPDSDPYAALADDDADEAEIADWMAFTEGDIDEPDGDTEGEGDLVAESGSEAEPESEPEPGSEPEPETEPDPDRDRGPQLHDDVPTPSQAEDETAEIPVTPSPVFESIDEPAQPATSVELDDVDAGGHAVTEEVPIITGAESATADATDVSGGTEDQSAGDESAGDQGAGDDPAVEETARAADLEAWSAGSGVDAGDEAGDGDTGELPIVEHAAPVSEVDDDTGELDPVPDGGDDHETVVVAGATPVAARPVFDLEAADLDDRPFDEGDYFSTATRDHEGLAAAIAEAETEETEQVALAAQIPGLESTVVGFEDVVEAEGHTRVRARASGDLVARVITAVILIAALGASLVWRPALVALATVVFIIGAGEFYTALRRSGRQPIALFGFIGILGASLGGFVWGAVAIPASFFLVGTLLLLFYAVVPGKPEPMANLALTVTVMVWAGLGTYAMMIVESTDYRPLVVGVVLTVALMDIAQYFIGRTLGRHPLSPWVSPKKTVEGLVGGVIVALSLGALLHFIPPFELTSGLAIGAAVAVLSPLGDLAMSAAKRSLAIKDMGSILPGHGGFLDRIDGLLFVIPAAWAIFLWAGLI